MIDKDDVKTQMNWPAMFFNIARLAFQFVFMAFLCLLIYSCQTGYKLPFFQ